MALTRMSSKLPLNCLTYLPLALVGLLSISQQSLAQDRLGERAASRRQPPAIFSYARANQEADGEALASHRLRKPYSWNNQRLAKQLQLADGLDGELTNWVAADDEAAERRRPMGDLSLLYSQGAELALEPAIGDNRWPTKGGASQQRPQRKPTSVEANRHGTKRRRTGTKGAPGTKSISRQSPAVNRRQHRPQTPVGLSPERPIVVAASNDSSSGLDATPKRAQGKRKNLVCYYGTWAVYRPDAGKFSVENIDPFLCTHVIYGFAGLSYDNLIKPLDPWNDLEDNYGKGAMKRFTNLKRINPDLKTLVAIGGWNEGSVKYSKMASEPEARARFVESVLRFLEKFNFDGLDLDWEYPGSRGGASYDKQNFVRLLRELNAAFKPRGYLLTAAVSAGKWFVDPAYDIPQVSKYLDLINLMAYDYHGGWESKTGMNAPLFSSPKHDQSVEETMLNVNWSVNYWLAQGAAREKLMLGVGSYGRSFTLDNGQVNGLNAPASQKGRAGPYTREPGSLGYNELCESFQAAPQSWSIVRDPDYLAPYAYNTAERQWVGYDDRQSLALKAQFAKSMGLGGMMMWSIETDDFQGRCHEEKFPLLNTIRRVLEGQPDGPPQRPPATTARPAPVTTQASTQTTTSKRPPGSTARPAPTTPAGEIEDEPAPSSTSTTTTTTTRKPANTTRRPRPPATTTSTTQKPPSQMEEFECRADGMFADPRNCRKFYRCVGQATGRFQRYHFDCAPGTAFNEAAQYCDYVYNVPSCNSNAPPLVARYIDTTGASHKPVNQGKSLVVLARQYYPSYGFSQNQFSQVHHLW